ncbi:MAG: S-layer homology domain-containing protein, partial [Oscillospiraceae bacterium]|nr:S-layer homology domain-containing protein [Oscillospiraceae bacterium]
ALFEGHTGAGITAHMSFTDTSDVNVGKMAGLGVVNGVGDNRFSPDSPLTREQAATMLARLAEVIGNPLEKIPATYADNSDISSWAIEQVGQVQAVGIMGGVGSNTFAPKGPYTREQSIVTMLRLWEIVHTSDTPSNDVGQNVALLGTLTSAYNRLMQFSQSLGYTTGELYDTRHVGNDPASNGSEITYASLQISNNNWRVEVTLSVYGGSPDYASVAMYRVFVIGHPERTSEISKSLNIDISALEEQLVYFSTLDPSDIL